MGGRTALILLSALLALCGCYESPGVTIHEPGVYKGSGDPLLAELKKSETQEELQERFRMVQTDR